MKKRLRIFWVDLKFRCKKYRVLEKTVAFYRGCVKCICSNVAVAVLLRIATCFDSDLPDKIPTIFGWFQGWLVVTEFAMKSILGGLYAMYTGCVQEFVWEWHYQVIDMTSNMMEWLQLVSAF